MQNEANTKCHKCSYMTHHTQSLHVKIHDTSHTVIACKVDFQFIVLLLSSTRLIVKSDAKRSHFRMSDVFPAEISTLTVYADLSK